MAHYVKVATTSQVQPGTGIVASVNGRELAVFNVNGTFHVIDNICKHRGGPLGEGELDGEIVTCPWHSWQFNVKTGECLTKAGEKMDCFEVRMDGADVTIALP